MWPWLKAVPWNSHSHSFCCSTGNRGRQCTGYAGRISEDSKDCWGSGRRRHDSYTLEDFAKWQQSKEMQAGFNICNIAVCGGKAKQPAGGAGNPPWQPDPVACEVTELPSSRMGAFCTQCGAAWDNFPQTQAGSHSPGPATSSGLPQRNLPPHQANAAPAVSHLPKDRIETFLIALFCSLGEASACQTITGMTSF